MNLVLGLFIVFIIADLKDCQSIDEEKYNSFYGKQRQYEKIPTAVMNPCRKKLSVECRNVTLDLRNARMLPDGRLHFKPFNMTVNSSHFVRSGRVVTLCHPAVDEEYNLYDNICRPFYFSVLAFVFQMQVPVVACLNCGFRRIGPSLIVSFILCFVSAYYIVPVDMWLEDTSSFFSFWFTTPCVLNFISLSTVGWINLLTCDIVVSFLMSVDQITITATNEIVLKRFTGILKLSTLIGIAIAVFTFVTVHSQMIESVTGLSTGFGSLGRMMPYLFPTVLILSIVNVIFFVIGRVFPVKELSTRYWSRIGDKNTIFFGLHIFLVINWIFGCMIIIKDLWGVWNMFAVVSVLIPGLTLKAVCVPEDFDEFDYFDQPPLTGLLDNGGEKLAFDIAEDKTALLAIKVETPMK